MLSDGVSEDCEYDVEDDKDIADSIADAEDDEDKKGCGNRHRRR